jgi:hypothetical protein
MVLPVQTSPKTAETACCGLDLPIQRAYNVSALEDLKKKGEDSCAALLVRDLDS